MTRRCSDCPNWGMARRWSGGYEVRTWINTWILQATFIENGKWYGVARRNALSNKVIAEISWSWNPLQSITPLPHFAALGIDVYHSRSSDLRRLAFAWRMPKRPYAYLNANHVLSAKSELRRIQIEDNQRWICNHLEILGNFFDVPSMTDRNFAFWSYRNRWPWIVDMYHWYVH
jgi:hypothetical protein